MTEGLKIYKILLLFLKGLDKILKVLQFKFYMFLKESVIFSKRCYGLLDCLFANTNYGY